MKLKEFIETFEQPCCGGLSKEDVEIALKKQAEQIFNLFRNIEVRHPCSCGRQHKVPLRGLVESLEAKHYGGSNEIKDFERLETCM